MIFQEKETKEGFEYTLHEVFGSLTIISAEKLTGDKLDTIAFTVQRTKQKSGTIDDTIKFTFEPTTPIAKGADIYDFIPDLKDHVPMEDILTAMVASMDANQRDRFREALYQSDLIKKK